MFTLKFDKILQNKFEIRTYNVLLVFQVNCPGCLSHAIPLFNTLYHRYKKDVNFLALSTAFEDFTLNTEENTKFLLEEGKLVGESKNYFKKMNRERYEQAIDFPVAMDKISKSNDIIDENFIQQIVNTNPNYPTWPIFEQETMIEKVRSYYAKSELLPYTFTSNQLGGTPSYVFFDENFKIFRERFGHFPAEEFEEIISTWLQK